MKKITIILLITIITENLQQCWCESIPESKDLFDIMNNKLQIVINTMSRRNNNLLKSKKIILLLKMQENLKKLTEKNLKTYQDIQNAFKSSDTDTVKSLYDLIEVIKEILKHTYKFLPNSTSSKGDEIKMENIASIASNDTDHSVEILQYSKYFLDSMDEVKSKDVINTLIKSSYNNNISLTEFRQARRKHTYNLKLWRPKNSSDEIGYNIHRRIFDDNRADIRKYPFIVSVHVMEDFMCAGSIISKDLVITAASCLIIAYNNDKYKETADITVRAGSDYTNRGGELLTVTDVYFHPAFDPAYLKNNLAIAKIKTGFRFRNSRSRIRRVAYKQNEETLPNYITMIGWGVKNLGMIGNNEPLSSTNFNIYKLQSCKEIYYRNYVTSKNFCAGFAIKGGGACKRDVGGPGVVGGILVGVVSFGPPVCGTPGAPTVFTKLDYYVKWIDNAVKTSIAKIIDRNVTNISGTPKQRNKTETATQYDPYDNSAQIPENDTSAPFGAYDNSSQTSENGMSTPMSTTENEIYLDKRGHLLFPMSPFISESTEKIPAYYDEDYKKELVTAKESVGYYDDEHQKIRWKIAEQNVSADRDKEKLDRQSTNAAALRQLYETKSTTPDPIEEIMRTFTIGPDFNFNIEDIEEAFLLALQDENGKVNLERSKYEQTMLMKYESEYTTKAMKKGFKTKNSIINKDVNLSDNSDNYEEEDVSQGLNIEYKVTQLNYTKQTTTKKSKTISDTHKETDRDGTSEIINGGLSNETLSYSSDDSTDEKRLTRKYKNRFRQIKGDIRARKHKKKSKATSAIQMNKKNYNSHDSHNDVVLISRTMPNYDNSDSDLEQESDEENSKRDTRRSILDYVNINK